MALNFALVFTVALLGTKAYFVLGSIPLLILKHDSPIDAQFVRKFFSLYYFAAIFTASGTAISYAFAGRPWLALGAAVLALLALRLRRKIIPEMHALGAEMQTNFLAAMLKFRKTHMKAIAFNTVQLIAIIACLVSVGQI
jgi:hypothetical protein